MARFQNTARKAAENAKTVMSVVPRMAWWRYAALRLGTFIMTYFLTIGSMVIGLALFGVVLSFGAILALVPFAVFLAIRVSGVLTEKHNVQDQPNSQRATPS